MKFNKTLTGLIGTTFAVLLVGFAATANAQGFDAKRKPEPNRPIAKPTQQFGNARPVPAAPIAQHHRQKHREPLPHAVVPAPIHRPPIVNPPKPAPVHVVHVDPHHAPAPPPQIVIVGQPPRKPTLLEKIVDLFR